MIVHDGISQFLNNKAMKDFGLSEGYFYSLPYECQRAIIMAGLDAMRDNKDNYQKKMALKQYDFEKKVKVKVLSFLNKNR